MLPTSEMTIYFDVDFSTMKTFYINIMLFCVSTKFIVYIINNGMVFSQIYIKKKQKTKYLEKKCIEMQNKKKSI